MKVKYVCLLLLGWACAGCEKTIVLDVQNSEPKVVIEGMLTNQAGSQYVKVSRSNDYYTSGMPPRVTDAVVQIADDQGQVEDFLQEASHPDNAGIYYPATPDFVGVVGRTYTLTVQVDGVSYTATDAMVRVTPIDSIGYRVNPHQKQHPDRVGKYYELLLYAKEPPETEDYYLFRFFENDTLTRFDPSDVYFADDKTLGQNIDGVPSPVYFAAGDTATVDMLSLTRAGYLYYNDLDLLLHNDGGMFSQPPVNCRTNLSNDAFGFFQVSAVSAATVIIKP